MFCDKNSKYLQALEVGFVLVFIAGVAHAQKGGAKGAMRKGGKGSGGGRGSGGGGCFSSDTMVWTKNESMLDMFATEVMVKDIIEGNLVRTLDTSLKQAGEFKFMWTRATDVTIYQGKWMAYNFSFSSGHHITVTSPHLMMIKKEKEFYFLNSAPRPRRGSSLLLRSLSSRVNIMQKDAYLLCKHLCVVTDNCDINYQFSSP